MRKNIIFILGVIVFSLLISIPLILPYFHTGYFPTHDGEWAVVRLGDMFRSLRDMQFPVRYSGNLNFGYGYPLFNFAYPFPYYIGIVIHFFGFGFVDSIKILFAISVVFSALFMFLLSQKIWNNTWAGLLSAFFYIYYPYRIVDLYVRGSIGESLSLALFPLIIYLLLKIVDARQQAIYVALGSFSLAALIMTHNIMSVLFLPILVIFIFLYRSRALQSIVIAIAGGIGLSAFFWLPALVEKHYILLSQVPIADRLLYFVKPLQLILPKWGYGVPTEQGGFSYQIGAIHILLLIIIGVFYFIQRRHNKLYDLRGILLVSICIYILFLFSPTAIIWKYTPFLKEINYPWTILAPVGFLISLLLGSLARQKELLFIGVIGAIITFFLIIPHSRPDYYFDKGNDFYLTNEGTTTSSQELMPLWVKSLPSKHPEKKVEVLKSSGAVDSLTYNSKRIIFTTTLIESENVRIHTIYYPGWNFTIDNQPSKISYENQYGVMDLRVPQGEHKIIGIFSETPMRIVADIISLVSLVLLFVIFVNKRVLHWSTKRH